jgi:large subunit ribosomal protein L30
MARMLKITQVKSIINSLNGKHRPVMEALGFKKNYRTLYQKDTPQIRGMLQKVRHLVVWEEIEDSAIPAAEKQGTGVTVIEKGTARSESQ